MDNSTKDIIFSCTCITIFLFSYVAIASDDYLQMLENEAEETKIDLGNEHAKKKLISADKPRLKKTVKNIWSGECDYSDNVLPSNLNQEEFSSYLKKCALGSSIFYNRLKPASQEVIYRNYKNSASVKLRIVRKDIQKYF